MIVYGVCVGDADRYRTVARTSLTTVLEAGDRVIERHGQTSIFTAYDSILDEVAGLAGVEGVVLLHEDVRVGPTFREELGHAVAQSDVAVAGTVGARYPPSLEWWRSEERYGHVRESRDHLDWSHGVHDVHTVDGLLLVLSPWAAEHLRFDAPGYDGFHGYADELCFRALGAGKRVIVDDFDVEHVTRSGFGDRATFLRADLIWRRRWRDASAYGGRTWDLLPGIWHLAYATVPARVVIAGILHRAARSVSRRST